ncbi:transcription/translation regulatory transformer protein RfaH [Pantoea sp. OXWO6B1]|uniref:transcription/translation regulatory transformer protein RfaH n=1 Tax=Pantoea sp. OXWO6B1 TaxID=1835724 RepID=UPI0007C7C02E|nr:transcription/translation regulatory transformer protein RfaH [Pantoea sp. OXWO6B1]OAD97935.1 RfaH [Pantoea sp. OXWO6B1]
MKQWYVLQTLFGQEKRAEAHLENQNVECWFPLYTGRRLADGKVTSLKPTPLFPGYGFACFDPEKIHTTTIKATRGVSQIVRFGERLAVMSDAQMKALKAGAGQVAQTCEKPPVHGDTLILESGVFEGFEAVWHEPKGAKRAIMLITLMGKIVELDMRKVRNEGIRFRFKNSGEVRV